MTVYDGKGVVTAINKIKIDEVSNAAGGLQSSLTTTMTDKKGKVMNSGKGKFRCNGDGIDIDMQMAMPAMPGANKDTKASMKSSESFINYPAKMAEGQSLPDAKFKMEGDASGAPMSMEYTVTDRKVEGKEDVTSPAGTWSCYKITFSGSLQMQMMGMKMPPFAITGTEWFAPGFGVVKTETTDKRGKAAGSTLITGLKK